MKKRIAILGISVIAGSLILTGCSKPEVDTQEENPPVENVENQVEPEVNEDIVVEKEESDDDFELTVAEDEANVFVITLRANDGNLLQTGTPYSVDKKVDDTWENVELNMAFTMQIIIVDGENPLHQTVDLRDFSPGTYRIIKSGYNQEKEEDVKLMAEVIVSNGK